MPPSPANELIRASSQRHSLSEYVSIPGLASFTAGALVYLWSSHNNKKVVELDHVQSLSQLSDLVHLALPALVAVRGRVGSHAPVQCELCDKQVVIHEVVEEEVWRKQRAEGRTVYEPFETRKVFEECEWYLEDGSGVHVKVENALQAGRLRSALEVNAEFVPEDVSAKSLSKVLMEKAWQMTKHGMRKTERYLPVGAVVTCVGELSPNTIPLNHHTSASTTSSPNTSSTGSGLLELASGSSSQASSSSGHGGGSSGPSFSAGLLAAPIHIGSSISKAMGRVGDSGSSPLLVLRKPVTGPSYITPLTVEQLKASLSGTARNCRMLAYTLGAVGLALMVRKAVRRVMQVLRERRIRRRVAAVEASRKARKRAAAAAAAPACASCGAPSVGGTGPAHGQHVGEGGAGAGEASGSDVEHDREPDTCVICLESIAETVFTQCGHMCCCVECGLGLDKCPICRIRGRAIKVYRP